MKSQDSSRNGVVTGTIRGHPVTGSPGHLLPVFRILFAVLLLGIGCNLPWGEVFTHPTVERRVKESLALPPVDSVPLADPGHFRFAMFGDPHVGRDTFHRLDRFREEVSARGIDFACVLGDLTDNATRSEMLQVQAVFAGYGIPVYAVPGNHDLWSAGGWEWFKELFGPGCKSFRAGPVRIILFDTACGTIGPTQFDWLAQELARPEAVKVVGTHYPLFVSEFLGISRLPSEAERYRLAGLLRDTGTWGLVSGHVHAFEAHQAAGVRYLLCGAMRQKLALDPPGYLLFTFAADSLAWEFVPLD